MFAALEYVTGIYALSVVVTLMVWLVIVVIRRLSSERPRSTSAAGKSQA